MTSPHPPPVCFLISPFSCLLSPVACIFSYVSFLQSPVWAVSRLPISCLPSSVSRLPSPHLLSPVSRLPSPFSFLLSNVSRAVSAADLIHKDLADLSVLWSKLTDLSNLAFLRLGPFGWAKFELAINIFHPLNFPLVVPNYALFYPNAQKSAKPKNRANMIIN